MLTECIEMNFHLLVCLGVRDFGIQVLAFVTLSESSRPGLAHLAIMMFAAGGIHYSCVQKLQPQLIEISLNEGGSLNLRHYTL